MLLDLLFPNRCLHCNRIIDARELVCGICMDQIKFTHHDFITPNFLTERCSLLFPVRHACALMQFEEDSLSRKIVHQLKYGQREMAGKVLAGWACERLDFAEEVPDLMISVPLHPRKLRERGYNQLHLFTETVAAHFSIDFDHQLVKRNHYRKAQAKKDKSHRTETEGLFSVAKRFENRHVLIIDDVFTTGNTMSSVAWEILKAGNNTVSVLVMAVDE
ncbi:double zinc ribbon domain-containing protein [Kaistella sp. PBT33-4]|uniref:ComF family protein n=1 Tax=Kaistella sp. PBT33-4 TaxID=3032000 RepID=UPI0023D8534E|nr:double zinc ribbon domain-containing protein [Kaistella sp. PBT33-4]MDF0718696.1 double zinc ribbon domain-containing protein [Kaistella sp. PBT33-4]